MSLLALPAYRPNILSSCAAAQQYCADSGSGCLPVRSLPAYVRQDAFTCDTQTLTNACPLVVKYWHSWVIRSNVYISLCWQAGFFNNPIYNRKNSIFCKNPVWMLNYFVEEAKLIKLKEDELYIKSNNRKLKWAKQKKAKLATKKLKQAKHYLTQLNVAKEYLQAKHF